MAYKCPKTLANKGLLGSLCFDEDIPNIKGKYISYGSESDDISQANLFFDALRKIDTINEVNLVFARCPRSEGVGLAVYNRLLRSSGFEVITL